jgi:hypothetical protein
MESPAHFQPQVPVVHSYRDAWDVAGDIRIAIVFGIFVISNA